MSLLPDGSGAPSQQFAFMWQCGHSHRVLIGSKTPNDAAYYAMVEAKGALHTINTLLVGDIEKLVSDPPVPTPVPTATTASGAGASATPTPSSTDVDEPAPTVGPTPTLGLPGPATGT